MSDPAFDQLREAAIQAIIDHHRDMAYLVRQEQDWWYAEALNERSGSRPKRTLGRNDTVPMQRLVTVVASAPSASQARRLIAQVESQTCVSWVMWLFTSQEVRAELIAEGTPLKVELLPGDDATADRAAGRATSMYVLRWPSASTLANTALEVALLRQTAEWYRGPRSSIRQHRRPLPRFLDVEQPSRHGVVIPRTVALGRCIERKAVSTTTWFGPTQITRVIELHSDCDTSALPDGPEADYAVRRGLPRILSTDGVVETYGQPNIEPRQIMSAPVWRQAPGLRRPVFVFAPFVAPGSVLYDIIEGLASNGRAVVLIETDTVRTRMFDDIERYRPLLAHSYRLPEMLRAPDWASFCVELIQRFAHPAKLIVGSDWALRNAGLLGGRGPTIDVQFNNVGHLAGNLAARSYLDITVAVYKRLAEVISSLGQTSEVLTIPIGIHPPRRQDRRQARELLGLGSGGPLVAWTGRLSPEKDPHRFVELAQQFAGKARFVMTGDGPLRDEVIDRIGASVAPQYLGFVPDSHVVLAAADLLVMTSTTEGIPIAAMEAIALGTPVVTTAVGGFDELIRTGINGFLTDGRTKELEQMIGDLLDDPVGLARLQTTTAAIGLEERYDVVAMQKSFALLVDGWQAR